MRAGTADLIAYSFYQLGYRPRESLVLVGVRRPDLRVGLTIRSDLPPPARQRGLPLDRQVRALRAHGDDAVVMLIVSDRPERRAGTRPSPPAYRPLVRDVRRRLEAAGCHVLDVLAVGAAGWRSYLCHDPACCPPAGHPLADVTDGALAAWMIAQGHVLAPDEQALLADVEPVARGPAAPGGPPPARPTAEQAMARWRALLARDPVAPPADPPPADPASGEAGATPSRDTPPGLDVRWLAAALQDRWFRDAVLLTLVPGAGTAPEEALAGVDSDALEGLFDAPPDAELLARGTALLATVARTAGPGERADALALMAWAAWWSGEGVRGRLLAARAMADQPSHTLAALVDQLLYVGVPPGWAARVPGERAG